MPAGITVVGTGAQDNMIEIGCCGCSVRGCAFEERIPHPIRTVRTLEGKFERPLHVQRRLVCTKPLREA